MKAGKGALTVFTLVMLNGCGEATSVDHVERAAEDERRDDARVAGAAGARADRQAADKAYARDQDAKVEAREAAAVQPTERDD